MDTDKHLLYKLSKLGLQEACKGPKRTGSQVQKVQPPGSQMRRPNHSTSKQASQQHSKDQKSGNKQTPSAFKAAESHSKPAIKAHYHPTVHPAHQAPGGARFQRKISHSKSGPKEAQDESVRPKSTGPKGGQHPRQPQQLSKHVQKRSETICVKDRIKHRDQSEPCRINPMIYGSQPNLLDIARESNTANGTQRQQRPRGRPPFRQGKGKNYVQITSGNDSQQHHQGPWTPWKRGNAHQRQDTKPAAKESRKPNHLEPATLDNEELMQLEAMAPVDIVIKLASPISGLKEFLKQENTEKNLIASFLKILSATFNCKSNRHSLHYLLDLIKKSMFLKITLPTFIMSAKTEVLPEAHLDTSRYLGYTLKLLCQLITVYPASAFVDVSLLATLVQSTSNYLQSIGFPVSEETGKSLEDLHQMVAFLQKRQQDGNLKSDTYTYFVKPEGNEFRHISIYPTYDDIHLIDKPFVRPNIINEEYPDTATYLDIQFRLLREDFVRPLREGISNLLSCNQNNLQKQKIDDIRIYFNAQVLGPLCTHTGVFYQVKFNKKSLKSIQWESSKRLLYGSFLCLSKDNFETMLFATVEYRNVQELRNGIVTLRFTEGSRLDLVDVKSTDSFLMVETTAYFEAYRHVLEGFKQIRDDEIPFQKYIVQCQTDIAAPKYLKHTYQSYTLEPLSYSKNFNLFDFAKWPSKERLQFDDSQIRAVQTALTKELAIIQGPPGTGKTFLGLKIVSVLLSNIGIWQSFTGSPILVVCYTNHALDQFLEGISTFLETGLVRVGGRSDSKILAGFTMHALRKQDSFRKSLPKYMKCMYPMLIEEREAIQLKIESLAVSLEASAKGILKLCILSKYIQPNHLKSLQVGSQYNPSKRYDILEWLKVASAHEFYFATKVTQQQSKEEDWDETASSVTEGDLGNLGDLIEEGVDDDELINVTVEAELIQAERMIDEDDQQKQLQNARARRAAMENQFLAFNPKEDAPPLKSQSKNQDGGEWQVTKESMAKMKRMIKHQLQLTDIMSEDEATPRLNIWDLDLVDRWRLYRLWLSKYQVEIKYGILKYEQEYQEIVNRLAELRTQEEIMILRQSKVVGMTTTGAAKYRNLLQDIQPKIVIVEEAAEVLEAHIITTLSSACEHLILIGDHQQLRPSATVYELARKFNLEVSLFERLIRMDVPFVRLDYQHRMRPEIATLITPHIYDKLKNTESVKKYENIKGISTNLYFIEHQEPEDKIKEGKSFQNSHEAHFVKLLCEYFIQQEYKPSQITILTTYSGQLFCLKDIMPKRIFDGVKVCVVDKYQGEENDIVILSLVRSNKQGVVGFLRIPNRVCVALSRAKKGFYCIGNMGMLAKQVPLWANIVRSLRETNNIGPSLRLCCQNHPGTDALVSSAQDFSQVPKGGCLVPCDFSLKCGHKCTLPCHPFDPMHEEYRCPGPCQVKCTVGHPCPKPCWQLCGNCKVKVEQVVPRCGHQQQVPCHVDPKVFRCQEPCERTLDCSHQCLRHCGEECTVKCPRRVELVQPCGHKRMVQCHQREEAEAEPCRAICGAPLSCDHPCAAHCFECSGLPFHAVCTVPCVRPLPCSHPCTTICGSVCPPCAQPCGNRCPHGRCPSSCGAPCRPCREPCIWACPHAKCTRLCHEPCDRAPCDLPCDLTLDCGHPCIGLCGEPCPDKCRVCHVEEVTEIFFGGEDDPETRFLQLQDCRHIFAVKEFDTLMQQSEADDSSASKLHLCPKCLTPIHNNVRYGTVIKKVLAKIERRKVKTMGDEEELRCRRACLEKFLEEKEELNEYYLQETQCLQFQLQESNTNLHKLSTLGHKINLLSKVANLKSEGKELGVSHRSRMQVEINLVTKKITKNRSQFTSQELEDIEREITKLKQQNKLYLSQNSIPKQWDLFDSSPQPFLKPPPSLTEDAKYKAWKQEQINKLMSKYADLI